MRFIEVQGRRTKTERLLTALKSNDRLLPKLYEGSLTLTDEEEKTRKGVFFISMPEKLTKALPGTYLSVNKFLHELNMAGPIVERALLGSYIDSSENPAFHKKEDGFQLTVHHGATNEHSLQLSRIAKDALGPNGFMFTDDQRKQYQQAETELIKPALQNEFKEPNGFCVIEDCIASGDSILGLMHLLAERKKLNAKSTFRVDAVVGTTQGILALRKYAQTLGIKLEINVGYLATGLTEGEDGSNGSRKHANYITYFPEFIKRLKELDLTQEAEQLDEYGFTVGDMGDAARKWTEADGVPKAESQIAQINNSNTLNENNEFNLADMARTIPNMPTHIFLARGGCLMKAMFDIISPSILVFRNTVGMRASRVWSQDKEQGYGVLVEAYEPQDFFKSS